MAKPLHPLRGVRGCGARGPVARTGRIHYTTTSQAAHAHQRQHRHGGRPTAWVLLIASVAIFVPQQVWSEATTVDEVYTEAVGDDINSQWPKMITLGVPVEMASNPEMLRAVDIAINDVNRDPEVLPHTELKAIFADTGTHAETAFFAALATVRGVNESAAGAASDSGATRARSADSPPPRSAVDAIFGAFYSETTEAVAAISNEYNLPMLSPTASYSALGDENRFKYFSRTTSSTADSATAVAGVIAHFGWQRVSIVSSSTSDMALFSQGLESTLRELLIETTGVQMMSEEALQPRNEHHVCLIESMLDSLEASSSFVVVVSISNRFELMTLLEAFEGRGMLDAPWVVIINCPDVGLEPDSSSQFGQRFVKLTQGALFIYEGTVCEECASYRQLAAEWTEPVVRQRAVRTVVDLARHGHDGMGQVLLPLSRSSHVEGERWLLNNGEPVRRGSDPSVLVGPSFFACYAYDGMRFFAQAMHDAIKLWHAEQRHGNARSMTSDTALPPTQVVLEALRHAVYANGTTGQVTLGASLTRKQPMQIRNMWDAHLDVVGWYVPANVAPPTSTSGVVTVPAAPDDGSHIDFVKGKPIHWPGGSTATPGAVGSTWRMAVGPLVACCVLLVTALVVGVVGIVGLWRTWNHPLVVWSGRTAMLLVAVGGTAHVAAHAWEIAVNISASLPTSELCSALHFLQCSAFTLETAGVLIVARRFYWVARHPRLRTVERAPSFSVSTVVAGLLAVLVVAVLLTLWPTLPRMTVIKATPSAPATVYFSCYASGMTDAGRLWPSLLMASFLIVQLAALFMTYKARAVPAGRRFASHTGKALLAGVIENAMFLAASIYTASDPSFELLAQSWCVAVTSTAYVGAVVLTRVAAAHYGWSYTFDAAYRGGDDNPTVSLNFTAATGGPPGDWEKQTENCVLCEERVGGPVWRSIAAMLKDIPGATLVSVRRVQNLFLWQRFSQERARLEGRNGHLGANIRHLWHGTGKLNPSAVYSGTDSSGFDSRKSSSGNRFGRASYFAERASYSHAYGYHTEHGHSQLILAAVQLGVAKDYGRSCKRSLTRPPVRPDNTGALFDSVTGGPFAPAGFQLFSSPDKSAASIVHCVYNSEKAYPAYVVTYKTNRGEQNLSAPASAVAASVPIPSVSSPPEVRDAEDDHEYHLMEEGHCTGSFGFEPMASILPSRRSTDVSASTDTSTSTSVSWLSGSSALAYSRDSMVASLGVSPAETKPV